MSNGTISKQWSVGRHFKQVAGVASGATLGFLQGNVPGAVIGGKLASEFMSWQDGDTYSPKSIKYVGSAPWGRKIGSAPKQTGSGFKRKTGSAPAKPQKNVFKNGRKYHKNGHIHRRMIQVGRYFKKRFSK